MKEQFSHLQKASSDYKGEFVHDIRLLVNAVLSNYSVDTEYEKIFQNLFECLKVENDVDTILFDFDRDIEFVLDCIDEASKFSWSNDIRTERTRKLDYEKFKLMNFDSNIIKIMIANEEKIGFMV